MTLSEDRPTTGVADVLIICLLTAILAAVGSSLVLRYGIRVETDSWSYWQGSVSIAQGHGYHYFDGRRVRMWPPLYAIYLAGWQKVAGVSGRTLALANITLACTAAFFWTLAFLLPCAKMIATARRRRPVLLLYPVAAALFIACIIVSDYRMAMSQNLTYALLPLALYFSMRIMRGRGIIAFAVLDAVVLCLLLLTHNSSIAFLPVLAILLLIRTHARFPVRLFVAIITIGIPVALWRGVLGYLRQTHTHPITFSGTYSWGQYAHQVVSGIAAVLGPRRFHLDLLSLAAVCACLFFILVRRPARVDDAASEARGALQTYLILTFGYLAFLYVIFNVTQIYDPLSRERFILFVPLTLFPAAALLIFANRVDAMRRAPSAASSAAPQRSRFRLASPASCFCLAITLAITVSSAARAVHWIRAAEVNGGAVDLARVDRDEGFAYNIVTIDVKYLEPAANWVGKEILRAPGKTGVWQTNVD